MVKKECWLGKMGASYLIWETFLEEVILELGLAESCLSEDEQVF